MENNKNKKSVKFQGDMLNFCDFIQVFVFTRNHHLKDRPVTLSLPSYFKNSEPPIIINITSPYETQYLTSINLFLILISMLTPLSHETVKILSLIIQ